MAVLAGSLPLFNLPHLITAEANPFASVNLLPSNAFRPARSVGFASDFTFDNTGQAVLNNSIQQLGGKTQLLGISGQATDNSPVAINSVVEVGALAIGYKDDFYDRIHTLPRLIDIGAVVTPQIRTFDVWNAHTINGQFLTSITPVNAEGVTLVQPVSAVAPTVYAPTEIRTYSLSVSNIGPATIDATFVFDWPPGSTPPDLTGESIFTLLGFRSVLFPFPPTWRGSFVERFEYMTDVLLAYDGTEQRMRLRKFPRKFYEFEISAFPDLAKGVDLAESSQIIDRLLWGFQTRRFTIPVWTDCLILSTDVSIGTTVFPVDPVNLDFREGGLMVIWKGIDNFEVLTILSLAGNQITTISGNSQPFTGPVRVYPGHTARLQTAVETQRPFDQFSLGTFVWRVEDNDEVPTPLDPAVTFKLDSEGDPLPVLQDRPERNVPLSHEFSRKAFEIDYRTGGRNIDDHVGSSIEIKTFRWVFGDRALHNTWKEMILSRAGRLKPIWIPSWHDDLKIVQPVGISDTFIDIRDIGYSTFYAVQSGRRDIQVLLKDGTRIYKRIISSSSPTPGENRLTLDETFGTLITDPDAEIAKVSWMGLYRLDTDLVEIAWPANHNSIIEVRFRLVVADTEDAS